MHDCSSVSCRLHAYVHACGASMPELRGVSTQQRKGQGSEMRTRWAKGDCGEEENMGGGKKGRGSWGEHDRRGAGGADQVAADPAVDKAESQDSKLEELSTAVICQETQATRQDAPCQRDRHCQAAAQSQCHPTRPHEAQSSSKTTENLQSGMVSIDLQVGESFQLANRLIDLICKGN